MRGGEDRQPRRGGQVAGNLNTMIMWRVTEVATVELLTDPLLHLEVFTLMNVSGVTDSSNPMSRIDF